MRSYFILLGLILIAASLPALAQDMPGTANQSKEQSAKPVDVSADDSLEWYQDQHLYVARGKAKAIRGDMVVAADTLMAHEREKSVPGSPQAALPKPKDKNGSGDIDKMTAEGHVTITDPKQRVTGDHAIYDLDQHTMIVTGNHLRYETEKETVTARDALEYYEDKKIAVARGNAVADKGDRHVEGDVLTAEFRDMPDGTQELWKMTSIGNVTVITKGNVSKGNKAVYDVSRDIAVLSGNVRVTRADGTQLTGDVGEVDFKSNQSRLMNEGHGRVRALLTSKASPGGPAKESQKKNKAAPTQAATE